MSELSRLEEDLAVLELSIERLGAEHRVMDEKANRLRSLDFIASNNIKLKDVELSDGKVSLGSDILHFGRWLNDNSTKPWCEWNGGIYVTGKVVDGSVVLNATGRMKELLW